MEDGKNVQKTRNILNRQIGKSRYPVKTSINLMVVEKHTGRNIRSLLIFAAFMLALAFFTRYMVIDKIMDINSRESRYNQQEELLEKLKQSNEVYDQVRAEYSHYDNSYLSDDERSLQDRMDILRIIEDELLDRDALQNISISGNSAVLTVNAGKLSNIAQIVGKLESKSIVDYVTVSNAQTDDATIQSGYTPETNPPAPLVRTDEAESETDSISEGGAVQPGAESEIQPAGTDETESEGLEPQPEDRPTVLTTMTIYFKSAGTESTESQTETDTESAAAETSATASFPDADS
ncbi:hypothetical protein ACTQ1N_04095 [Porcincola sp. LCP21S3_C12]|uniref:hypothetical protein n=1 Tax=Porcincola sp. LCP21S3_C12 TaxID=3438798 RepID=UPI003F9B2AC0